MKKRAFLLIGALLVLMTLCLGGCGGSNDSTESSEQSQESSQSQEADKNEVTSSDFEDDNSEADYTLGSTYTANGISVTLDSAKIIPDYDTVHPEEGYEFLQLTWTVKNDSDENYDPSEFNISGYADKKNVDTTVAVMDEYLTTDLLAGTSGTDQNGFEVPIGWQELVFEVDLSYNDNLKGKFTLTPDQCTQATE